MPTEVAEALVAQFEELWGTEAMAAMLVPSRAGDERFRRWLAKLVRTGASPRAAQAFLRAGLEVDVRPVLPLIQAPTLVLTDGTTSFFRSSTAASSPSTSLRPSWSSCLGPTGPSSGRRRNWPLT
jgi:hypothetical protein